MISLFIPLLDGQVLAREVLEGLNKQIVDLEILPITSSKRARHYPERNKLSNILRAIKVNKQDYFLLMDSDVVLEDSTIIAEMFSAMNLDRNIICVTTKGEQIAKCEYIPHALSLIKGEYVKKFKQFCQKYKGKECVYCQFLMQHTNQIMSLQNNSIRELPKVSEK